MEYRGLRFHVAPRNQGQCSEYAYSELLSAGVAYVVERCTDRSVPETRYRIARQLAGDDCQYWEHEPPNRRWRKIAYDHLLRMEQRGW